MMHPESFRSHKILVCIMVYDCAQISDTALGLRPRCCYVGHAKGEDCKYIACDET